ncbi:MAG: DUF6503 family protein [Bacteroidota bacterium]
MKKLLLILSVIPFISYSQTEEHQLLYKALNYHDPNEAWSELKAVFYFTETRPTGPDRKTTFELDNSTGKWKVNRNDEEVYEINGEEAVVIKGDKESDRGVMLRNYYLYLWGLPMKLKDASTPGITLAPNKMVINRNCYVFRVPYEAETYYFYIDKESGRMLQYKFYKDEEAGKGELIKLEDEIIIQGIRIPKKRSWYTLPEMKYLGTDILDRAE